MLAKTAGNLAPNTRRASAPIITPITEDAVMVDEARVRVWEGTTAGSSPERVLRREG